MLNCTSPPPSRNPELTELIVTAASFVPTTVRPKGVGLVPRVTLLLFNVKHVIGEPPLGAEMLEVIDDPAVTIPVAVIAPVILILPVPLMLNEFSGKFAPNP